MQLIKLSKTVKKKVRKNNTICKLRYIIPNIFRRTQRRRLTWLYKSRLTKIQTRTRRIGPPSGNVAGQAPARNNAEHIVAAAIKREYKKISTSNLELIMYICKSKNSTRFITRFFNNFFHIKRIAASKIFKDQKFIRICINKFCRLKTLLIIKCIRKKRKEIKTFYASANLNLSKKLCDYPGEYLTSNYFKIVYFWNHIYTLYYFQIQGRKKWHRTECLTSSNKIKIYRLPRQRTLTAGYKRRFLRMPNHLDRKCNNCANCKRSRCRLCIECNDDTCNLKCIRTICRENTNNRQRVLLTRQWMTSVFEWEKWRRREYFDEILSEAEMDIQVQLNICALNLKQYYTIIGGKKSDLFIRENLGLSDFIHAKPCSEINRILHNNNHYRPIHYIKYAHICISNLLLGYERGGVYVRRHYRNEYSGTSNHRRGKTRRCKRRSSTATDTERRERGRKYHTQGKGRRSRETSNSDTELEGLRRGSKDDRTDFRRFDEQRRANTTRCSEDFERSKEDRRSEEQNQVQGRGRGDNLTQRSQDSTNGVYIRSYRRNHQERERKGREAEEDPEEEGRGRLCREENHLHGGLKLGGIGLNYIVNPGSRLKNENSRLVNYVKICPAKKTVSCIKQSRNSSFKQKHCKYFLANLAYCKHKITKLCDYNHIRKIKLLLYTLKISICDTEKYYMHCIQKNQRAIFFIFQTSLTNVKRNLINNSTHKVTQWNLYHTGKNHRNLQYSKLKDKNLQKMLVKNLTKLCINNFYPTNKYIITRTSKRSAGNMEDIVLPGYRIRGAIAMVLQELREESECPKTKEAWKKANTGLRDRDITSDQVRHLLNHTYSLLGKENPREKTRKLMTQALHLPMDQIEYALSQHIDESEPKFRKTKLDNNKQDSRASSSHTTTATAHNSSKNRERDKHSSRESNRSSSSRSRHNSRENSRRRSESSTKIKIDFTAGNKETKHKEEKKKTIVFINHTQEKKPQHSTAPGSVPVDHIKLGKGDFFSFPEEWWPTRTATRLDVSLIKIRQEGNDCYWKDIYITPVHPTALFGFATLDRIRPFFSCCGIWAAAKTNPEIRAQLIKMLSNPDTEKAIRENIMERNRDWSVNSWVVRYKPNALELYLDKDNKVQSKKISLYKEPMFTPANHPNYPPFFSDGTAPDTRETEINKLPYLDIYARDKKIHSYEREDLAKMKGDCLEIIKNIWEVKVRQLVEPKKKLTLQDKVKTQEIAEKERIRNWKENTPDDDSDIQVLGSSEEEEEEEEDEEDGRRRKETEAAEKEYQLLLDVYRKKKQKYEKKLERSMRQSVTSNEDTLTEDKLAIEGEKKGEMEEEKEGEKEVVKNIEKSKTASYIAKEGMKEREELKDVEIIKEDRLEREEKTTEPNSKDEVNSKEEEKENKITANKMKHDNEKEVAEIKEKQGDKGEEAKKEEVVKDKTDSMKGRTEKKQDEENKGENTKKVSDEKKKEDSKEDKERNGKKIVKENEYKKNKEGKKEERKKDEVEKRRRRESKEKILEEGEEENSNNKEKNRQNHKNQIKLDKVKLGDKKETEKENKSKQEEVEKKEEERTVTKESRNKSESERDKTPATHEETENSSEEENRKESNIKNKDLEEKWKSDKRMMEKFYKFCEYEKSCKRKRKSQEGFKKIKLENSGALSESSDAESEDEERIKIQETGKRRISKSPTQKKHKSNDNVGKIMTGNNNISDKSIYLYDLKSQSSPLDYEPEEQTEANKSNDHVTDTEDNPIAGSSQTKTDSDTDSEEILKAEPKNSGICMKNSKRRCKACKRSKCRKCRECMNPNWKKKCMRTFCLNDTTKLERYRLRNRWVGSVLDQRRFDRTERMKREKTNTILQGEDSDDSFDDRDNSSTENEETRRERDTYTPSSKSRLRKYKKRQVESIIDKKENIKIKGNLNMPYMNPELIQPIYLTGATETTSNGMYTTYTEHLVAPQIQVRNFSSIKESRLKEHKICNVIKIKTVICNKFKKNNNIKVLKICAKPEFCYTNIKCNSNKIFCATNKYELIISKLLYLYLGNRTKFSSTPISNNILSSIKPNTALIILPGRAESGTARSKLYRSGSNYGVPGTRKLSLILMTSKDIHSTRKYLTERKNLDTSSTDMYTIYLVATQIQVRNLQVIKKLNFKRYKKSKILIIKTDVSFNSKNSLKKYLSSIIDSNIKIYIFKKVLKPKSFKNIYTYLGNRITLDPTILNHLSSKFKPDTVRNILSDRTEPGAVINNPHGTGSYQGISGTRKLSSTLKTHKDNYKTRKEVRKVKILSSHSNRITIYLSVSNKRNRIFKVIDPNINLKVSLTQVRNLQATKNLDFKENNKGNILTGKNVIYHTCKKNQKNLFYSINGSNTNILTLIVKYKLTILKINTYLHIGSRIQLSTTLIPNYLLSRLKPCTEPGAIKLNIYPVATQIQVRNLQVIKKLNLKRYKKSKILTIKIDVSFNSKISQKEYLSSIIDSNIKIHIFKIVLKFKSFNNIYTYLGNWITLDPTILNLLLSKFKPDTVRNILSDRTEPGAVTTHMGLVHIREYQELENSHQSSRCIRIIIKQEKKPER